MKRVIIQGDDWGYTEQDSRGVEYAYEHGILTQTTVLANLLDSTRKEEYRAQIDQLENKSGLNKGRLGIGVHLNTTMGKPLSKSWPQAEFTRPFRSSGKKEEWLGSAWAEYFSQFKPEQVEVEYREQIELTLDIFGEIDHLDSHHFANSYEPCKTIYEKLALEYDVAVRVHAPLSENPVYGGDFIYDPAASRDLQSRGIRTADFYLLTLYFNEDNPVETFLSELDSTKEGQAIEVMFHPAKGVEPDNWRMTDLNTLVDDRVIEYFKNADVELITYRDI